MDMWPGPFLCWRWMGEKRALWAKERAETGIRGVGRANASRLPVGTQPLAVLACDHMRARTRLRPRNAGSRCPHPWFGGLLEGAETESIKGEFRGLPSCPLDPHPNVQQAAIYRQGANRHMKPPSQDPGSLGCPNPATKGLWAYPTAGGLFPALGSLGQPVFRRAGCAG